MSFVKSTARIGSLCRVTLSQSLRPSIRSFSVSRLMREEAAVDPKITKIVDDIATLNLLETASLVKALKTRLNIQDIAMPVAAAAAPAAAAAAPAEAAAPAKEEKVEKTEFKITLAKVDAAAKAKVIREIKGLLPNANLVEAKKFVESVPKVIKENASKEEAEKIKTLLEGLGASVTLD
ncbi:ribosomal protein L7/L12 C-terminal domain-containing protein [Polychytrium aggregatum]|uniref:ribosomal protein L7/L12 C-terminal domain-containing protein n=1 Tax=Polychytrium aggregatum TaxID=110093 RepID=UPI0022FEA922|nr:ribosomal protein L7/L12 C-terminal domain-containing protein [Polychytrium aggregatum]KAI9202486.1 ribosomal protein L7/L12 C-terminal domain-containing protein [Polychytrium aggregatum]